MQKLLLLLLLTTGAAQAQSLDMLPPGGAAVPPPPPAVTPKPVAPAPSAWQGGLLMGHDLFRVTNQRPAFSVGQYRVVPRMTTPAPGFRIGFWARYNFGPGRRWLVQPEASYSRSQSWHRVTNTAANNGPGTPPNADFSALSTSQDWQRLNLALPVGYRLTRRLLVLGGPVLARRIPTGYERLDQGYAMRIVESINHSMRRNGLAWQAGVGYELGRVLLTARYERSLLHVARDIELDGQRYAFRHFATQISFGAALRVAPLR
ncbi:outer membrane beta-barrel protein [Hymenobacter jeollabukensis]|uniref:PorT family protein n=1 Tax=Hymenobacter jeollabukensis TaxID=2025313 RepID=A0A5R8WXQ9_9BACT|nr:outer membrane beta-barrel protein [Hymenobacter jeollabukensis]TLM96843.1 PorT family protein [Hymenobacter jeollabukensis]